MSFGRIIPRLIGAGLSPSAPYSEGSARSAETGTWRLAPSRSRRASPQAADTCDRCDRDRSDSGTRWSMAAGRAAGGTPETGVRMAPGSRRAPRIRGPPGIRGAQPSRKHGNGSRAGSAWVPSRRPGASHPASRGGPMPGAARRVRCRDGRTRRPALGGKPCGHSGWSPSLLSRGPAIAGHAAACAFPGNYPAWPGPGAGPGDA